MKKLILFLLLTIPLLGLSQSPRKSNTIIIHTVDSEDEAFKKIGRILLNEGFTLENIDKDFYMLVSNIKTSTHGFMNAGKVDTKINIQVDKKEDKTLIKITGKFASPQLFQYTESEFDSQALQIENIGAKGSPVNAAWLILVGLAEKYDSGSIEYLVN